MGPGSADRPRSLYQPSGPDRFELPPAATSAVIRAALESPRPRARYRVTRPTQIAAAGRRLLPTAALDWFARRS